MDYAGKMANVVSLPRLVSITALWRNNTDEGFGFRLAGGGVQDVANTDRPDLLVQQK